MRSRSAVVPIASGRTLTALLSIRLRPCRRLDAAAPAHAASVLECSRRRYADRLVGRELEYDARNGAVVRAGARLGIPTPYNETVTALLEAVSESDAS